MINLMILVLIHLSHYVRIVQIHHRTHRINPPTDQSTPDDIANQNPSKIYSLELYAFILKPYQYLS